MTDRACERMSSGLKEPSVFARSRRQRQRPSLRGGALAEGECGRIFRDGSRAGREASGARRGESAMTQIEVLASMPNVRGGYKVDVSRGTRIGRVSSEWFNRPPDERFLSLTDLWNSVKSRSERSRTRIVESAAIRVEASRDNAERLALVMPGSDRPIAPTHWSFGQLAGLVGAPANYLRQLPAPLAGINLQYGLSEHRAEQVKTLEIEDGRVEVKPSHRTIHGSLSIDVEPHAARETVAIPCARDTPEELSRCLPGCSPERVPMFTPASPPRSSRPSSKVQASGTRRGSTTGRALHARPMSSSGKRYRGINTVALWVAAMAAGYGDGLWGTYRQWQDAGAQVRKGERSTTVVLWKQIASSAPAGHDDQMMMKMATAGCSPGPSRCSTSRRWTDTSSPPTDIAAGERASRACGGVHRQPRHQDRVRRFGSLLSSVIGHGVHAGLRFLPRCRVVLWRLAA